MNQFRGSWWVKGEAKFWTRVSVVAALWISNNRLDPVPHPHNV